MIPVVAAALIDARNRVLMQRRPPGKAHAGLWEFPGGKVESAETLKAALVRELREELAIDLCEGSLEPLIFASLPGVRHVVLLYTCRQWCGLPACQEPGAELDWRGADGLLDLPMPPLDIPLAVRLQLLLSGAN